MLIASLIWFNVLLDGCRRRSQCVRCGWRVRVRQRDVRPAGSRLRRSQRLRPIGGRAGGAVRPQRVPSGQWRMRPHLRRPQSRIQMPVPPWIRSVRQLFLQRSTNSLYCFVCRFFGFIETVSCRLIGFSWNEMEPSRPVAVIYSSVADWRDICRLLAMLPGWFRKSVKALRLFFCCCWLPFRHFCVVCVLQFPSQAVGNWMHESHFGFEWLVTELQIGGPEAGPCINHVAGILGQVSTGIESVDMKAIGMNEINSIKMAGLIWMCFWGVNLEEWGDWDWFGVKFAVCRVLQPRAGSN